MPMIMMAGVFTVVLTREDLWHCARRFEAFFTTRTMKPFSIMCLEDLRRLRSCDLRWLGCEGCLPSSHAQWHDSFESQGVRFPWKRFCFLVTVFICLRNMGRKHSCFCTCSKAVLRTRSQEPRRSQPVQGPCHSIERYLPGNGSP